MAASTTTTTTTTSNRPGLIRKHPQGISVTDRMIKKINNANKSKSSRRRRKPQPLTQVGFGDEAARDKALEFRFVSEEQEIQISKSLDESVSEQVYRIEIYDIDKLSGPSKYYQEIFKHLGKYGTVLELHLHYAESDNWFRGDGCAFWIGKEDVSCNDFGFFNHFVFNFFTESYRVSN